MILQMERKIKEITSILEQNIKTKILMFFKIAKIVLVLKKNFILSVSR